MENKDPGSQVLDLGCHFMGPGFRVTASALVSRGLTHKMGPGLRSWVPSKVSGLRSHFSDMPEFQWVSKNH